MFCGRQRREATAGGNRGRQQRYTKKSGKNNSGTGGHGRQREATGGTASFLLVLCWVLCVRFCGVLGYFVPVFFLFGRQRGATGDNGRKRETRTKKTIADKKLIILVFCVHRRAQKCRKAYNYCAFCASHSSESSEVPKSLYLLCFLQFGELGSGSARLGPVPTKVSGRPARLGLARLGSGSARLGSVRLGSARARLGSARLGLGSGSARFGLGSVRARLGLGWARLGLGWARLGSSSAIG